VIAGLSSLGLPGLAGFVAEFLVFLGAWSSAHSWWLIPGVLGAFITALYVLRAVRTIFLGPPSTPISSCVTREGWSGRRSPSSAVRSWFSVSGRGSC
jgi:NADH-quinone oxidoreductase subunit M